MPLSTESYRGQAEEAILLRIRVAVLENEVKHEKNKAEDAIKTLAVVIQAIALQSTAPVQQTISSIVAPGHTQDRGGITTQETSAAVDARKHAKTVIEFGQQIEVLKREIRNLKANPHILSFSNPMVTKPSNVEEYGDMGYIPSSPNLSANYSAGITNVGIRSLDDILGGKDDSGNEADNIVKKEEMNQQVCLTSEYQAFASGYELIANEEKNNEHENAVARLQSIPVPNVFETGFFVKGSCRGRGYEFREAVQPGYSGHIRKDNGLHVTRNTNRFAPSSGGTRAEIESAGGLALFDSREERVNAIETQRNFGARYDVNFPEVFRHGIMYTPNKRDSNLLRTVHIGNLPIDIHLRDVLARVRGGAVVSAILLDTKPITGSMSVLVQFALEAAANQYFDFAANCPIYFGQDNNKVLAEVTLLSTPTYPVDLGRARGMAAHNQTRCLVVHNFSSRYSIEVLERGLSCGNKHRANSLLELFFDKHSTIHLEFASIDIARSAYAILRSWNEYHNVYVEFEADPCARPVEELLLDVPEQKPMFPKGGFISSTQLRENISDKCLEHPVTHHRGSEVLPFESPERKRLAASSNNQKDKTSSFNGTSIRSSSWADDYEESPQKTPESLNAGRLSPNPSKDCFIIGDNGGLAASEFASVSSNATFYRTNRPRSPSQTLALNTIHEVGTSWEKTFAGQDGTTNGADRKEFDDGTKAVALKPVLTNGAVDKRVLKVQNPDEINLDFDSDSDSCEQRDDESEAAALVEEKLREAYEMAAEAI